MMSEQILRKESFENIILTVWMKIKGSIKTVCANEWKKKEHLEKVVL